MNVLYHYAARVCSMPPQSPERRHPKDPALHGRSGSLTSKLSDVRKNLRRSGRRRSRSALRCLCLCLCLSVVDVPRSVHLFESTDGKWFPRVGGKLRRLAAVGCYRTGKRRSRFLLRRLFANETVEAVEVR